MSSPTSAECVREIAEEPQQLANLLAFLQLSLEDPEFRACAERHDATLEREMAALLDEARERGEMVDVSSRALARAVIAMMRGSLLTWSAIGKHTAPERLGEGRPGNAARSLPPRHRTRPPCPADGRRAKPARGATRAAAPQPAGVPRPS